MGMVERNGLCCTPVVMDQKIFFFLYDVEQNHMQIPANFRETSMETTRLFSFKTVKKTDTTRGCLISWAGLLLMIFLITVQTHTLKRINTHPYEYTYTILSL